jgi:hypothetical protein
MKVNSRIYKGIEYIQLNDLPQDQQEKIIETLHSEFFIKILIDTTIIKNCIQYKDYEMWFDSLYVTQQSVPAKVERHVEISSTSMVFGKA